MLNLISTFIIVVLCCFHFTLTFAAKSTYKQNVSDTFVLKVEDEVFSLNELKEKFKDVQLLECVYPDALVLKVFPTEFSKKNKKFYKVSSDLKKPLNEAQMNYFKGLTSYLKLLVYSKSHSIVVGKNLQKSIMAGYLRNSCYKKTGKKLVKNFMSNYGFLNLLKLEIFLNERFTNQKDVKSTLEVNKKVKTNEVKSIIKFINSINKQIDAEFFW